MTLVKDYDFLEQLFNILLNIKKDKTTPVRKFEKELDDKLELLLDNPQMCRKSNYFEDENYRDLIYSGYTIIYKIQEEKILILEIFKWQNR